MNKINIEEESELGTQTERKTDRINIDPNIIVRKNGGETVKKKYPYVGYILLDNVYDATEDNRNIIQDEIDNKYNCGQYINLKRDEIGINEDVLFLNEKLRDFGDNKLAEGLKLNLKVHGNGKKVIFCDKKTIDVLKKIAPSIKEFLRKNRQAKLYIQVEACMGANMIPDGKDGYTDLYAELTKLYSHYIDRIYCRCCKTGYFNNVYIRQEPLPRYHRGEPCPKGTTTNEPIEKKRKKTTYLQYFPLAKWQERMLDKYGTKKAKSNKNSALGFTKDKGNSCSIF